MIAEQTPNNWQLRGSDLWMGLSHSARVRLELRPGLQVIPITPERIMEIRAAYKRIQGAYGHTIWLNGIEVDDDAKKG